MPSEISESQKDSIQVPGGGGFIETGSRIGGAGGGGHGEPCHRDSAGFQFCEVKKFCPLLYSSVNVLGTAEPYTEKWLRW